MHGIISQEKIRAAVIFASSLETQNHGMRILLIEDSLALAKAVTIALKKSGYAVDHTADGAEGLFMAQQNDYDAAVIDIMLPSMNGLEIVRQLRAAGNSTKILFLTAKDTIQDRVIGLQTGADDYLIKPFALEELIARVEVMCRRTYDQASSSVWVGQLEVDTTRKTARYEEQDLGLRAREYNLLEYLALRKDAVVSRAEIEAHIYDELVTPMSNVVDAAIYSLRKTLAACGEGGPTIETRRGQGYLLKS